MRHGHQASADRAKAVPTQQVESQGVWRRLDKRPPTYLTPGSQGPQQRYHLDSVALAVVVYVLAELGVPGPVPLAFDCPRAIALASGLALAIRLLFNDYTPQ